MNAKFLIKLTILVVLMTCAFHQSYGQKGVLKGVVTDKITGSSLPFATIIIAGTNNGSITNLDGEYTLTNIPTGKSTIVFSFVSYLSDSIEVVNTEGETKILDVQLSEGAIGLDEVVVTAQLMGQRKAISQQINSDALVNVVSFNRIKELPDVNAAEAIGRISGVSVQRTGGEADKVFLRGLSPSLTSITINGVKLPATGGSDRSVDLSTISPELLSSIAVYKSPTADMDGDAIGGSIRLGLGKAPMERVATARWFGGYNNLTSELSNYRGSINLSQRFMDKKIGVSLKGNIGNTNRSSERSNVNWDNSDTSQYVVSSLNLSNQERFIKRYGFNSQLDYQYGSGNVIGNFFYSGKNTDSKTINNNISSSSVDHNPSHSKTKTGTYQLMLSGKQRIKWLKANWVIAKNSTTNDNYHDVQLNMTQLSGVDPPDRDPLTADELYNRQNYNYDNAYIRNYTWEPSLVEHENLTLSLDLKADLTLGKSLSGFVKIGGKFREDERFRDHNHQFQNWYYLDPNIRNEAAALWPYELIRGGTAGDHIMISNFYTPGNETEERKDQYLMHPNYNFNTINEWHQYQQSTLNPIYDDETLKYNVNEKVSAAYIMAKLNYKKWLTIIPGLRYEGSDNSYTGKVSSLARHGGSGSVYDTTTYQNYSELLPSVHVKIKPTTWNDIRLSAVKTLARPNYNMLTPRATIDLSNGRLARGNPELKHAVAWNYDASLSFYPKNFGLITIGGFYKQFDNYFTSTDRVMSADEALKLGYPAQVYDVTEDYINFDKSKVYGIEFEIQTSLSFLPGALKGIVFNFNSTRLWSETSFPRYEKVTVWDPLLQLVVVDIENSYYIFSENKLPNQVDWQNNFSIGYDYNDFSIRVSTIYQLTYLSSFNAGAEAGKSKFNDRYTDSFLRFDTSISQKIGKRLKIMVNIANITGESERGYVYQSKYQTFENRYRATFDLGLQFKLY